MRVLILSSSMGAGHDGAGRELIRRLEAQGHEARMHDYLDALPLRIGHLVRGYYHLQLRYAPWSYENSFHTMPRIYRLLAWLNGFFCGWRLRRWMRAFPPDVIVSNNPLATLALGWRRTHGRLDVPAVTYVTDFGVHRLWVHRGIDLHLTVHPDAARDLRRWDPDGDVRAPGPLVGSSFGAGLPDRAAARRSLGLSDDTRAVLVVAGSWGVGEVEHTARLLADSGRYTPVTVCGRDQRLRERLEDQGLGLVIGWTDEMATLMAAADALVENAGGLTSMEALAAGLPVVTFHPIPGHGRENATAMARAGVTCWPSSPAALLDALDEVTVAGPAREALIAAGRAAFSGDAAADVVAAGASAEIIPIDVARARRRRVSRRIAAAGLAGAALYSTMTAGVAVAASYGLTLPSDAHPHRNVTLVGVSHPVTYLGVRLTPAEVADPGVEAALVRAGATAIVTSRTAAAAVDGLQRLVSSGVEVASGGCGRQHAGAFPEQLDVGSARLIGATTGVRPTAFVPARPVDALDLLWAGRSHVTIVVPRHTVLPSRLPERLDAGQSYVVDGRSTTPAELVAALDALEATAHAQGTVLSGLGAFE